MSNTDDIKQRLDIADFIGEYIKLKPAGSGSFKAVCPFHREKTPSFYVSREKQIWHCFGCGVGGDAFKFLMQMEGLDFSEALRQLAEKTGVKIERYVTEGANEKTRIYAIMDLAVKYYHRYLLESENATAARAYLERRGLSAEIIEKFQLGFSPDAWETAVQGLKKKGYREQEIIDSGLALRSKDGRNAYDRFRGRIMFPIFDVRGKAVGFSARVLDAKSEEPKYINTPQTTIYNKSQILYGLHLAKQSIKASGAVVIVEGNMDVVASHKGSVEAVVASSGTALTHDQVGILRRFTDTILMCFDADLAGESAAKRGIDVALEEGMNVKVIRLDGAKDPDELVTKDPALWRRVIANATDVMTYYFEKAFEKGAPKTAVEKKQIGKLLLPEIARLADPIEKESWLKELSGRLGISVEVLNESMAKLKNTKAITSSEPKAKEVGSQKTDRRVKLAENFLALLFARSELHQLLVEAVKPEYLPEIYRPLYLSFVSEYHMNAGSDFFASFRKKIEEEVPQELSTLDRIALLGERSFHDRDLKELRLESAGLIEPLRELATRNTRELLASELHDAESSGDSVRVEELTQKFNQSV